MLLEEKLRRLAGWLGAFAFLIGAVALAGWFGGFDVLRPLRPTAPAMKANTALCLALCGASLWLQHRGQRRTPAVVLAAIAGAVSLLTLAQYAFGITLGIDELLVRDTTGTSPLPGRITLPTALAYAVVSAALIVLHRPRGPGRWPVSAWLGNFVVSSAAAALLGLGLLNQPGITRPFLYGLHVALGLLALGIGILLARPDDPHVRTLFSSSAAGVFARRLFLGVAVLPMLLAAIFVLLLHNHAIEISDGAFLLTIALVLTGFTVGLFSIEQAVNIHESREASEQARVLLTARLQEQASQLTDTVGRRTQELREANASLRAAAESNALLALVAQATTNGVVITDAEGLTQWVNGAFERVTGYELIHVKGRKPGEFLQGKDTDPAAIAEVRTAVREGRPCKIEILNYTRDGKPFWSLMDLQPVRDRNGRLVNFVANVNDVTEQRDAKDRLEHLNDRFVLATRAAELGVWEWDAITQKSIWDERTLEMYGLTATEFKGTNNDWNDRLHPEDRDRVLTKVQGLLATDDTYEIEFRIVRASDGAVRHLLSRAIIQRDASRRLVRVTGTERDVTEEREARWKMERLNERLRIALRSSNYGVWEYDLTTGRRHWDERVLEIYGLQPGDFDGSQQAWEITFHPEDREACLAEVQRAIDSTASDYDIKFRIVRPDGSIRYLEAHGHVQRDAQGKALRLVGLSRDVTERKQLEEALDLAEQRWQLAIEGTNDSVWDWDVTTGQVYHDDRWTRMLGYEPGELKHTNDEWKSLAHPDDLPGNEAAIAEHFAQRTPFYQHELRMRTRDGGWRWILDRGKVVSRATDGRPLRMAGTHTDVTARRELEERLRKSEQLANEVSRLALIGGWEVDFDTSRVTWTEGTRRIHEVDEGFVPTAETVWQFFPPDALATLQQAIYGATPTAPSFDIEVPLTTARGRRAWVRLLGHGAFRSGKVVSVHGAIQDVTTGHESDHARRELEAQLFQAQKMETLGTLAGGIAHDFNNLLTGIIGYHELAADSVPDDHPARACLAEARNASLRARELVEQILTFGRQSGGTEHAPIDLSMVVNEARRFLRATLPANINIDVICAERCPHVLADATQIHQVILNLGSNAAHAMRHNGGTLRITLDPVEVSPDLALTLGGPAANAYVRLSVSDTGHGMDESTRRRIFDPFFTTKNTREGTGLGLAVVHGIVRSHRGAIDVESTPGQGSSFHVYLPCAATEGSDLLTTLEAAPRGGGEFICVVDDEEVVGSCTKLVLENKGYRTMVFSSAEQCIAELQSNVAKCAVLLTDQTMPGMQGTELSAALRRLRPDLPIVIMSGYFSKISPQALDELGQIELLAKPFTTDELAHAIHRALHPSEQALL